MIAKGKSISHLSAAVNYAFNKEESVVLDKNIASENPLEVEREFRMFQKLNCRCERNTFAFVLSPTIEDGKKLSNEDWVKINKSFLEKMHLDNHQYIAFFHKDKKHKHIHLYVNRIDYQGKAYDDKFIGKRSSHIAEMIAKEMNMTTAKEIQQNYSQKKKLEHSKANLGIYLKSYNHKGLVADKLESMEVNSRIVSKNCEILTHNCEALIENPSTILPELTSKTATFTQLQLMKAIQKRIVNDDNVVENVFESALKNAVIVGEGVDGKIRYTTQDYKNFELIALRKTTELLATSFEQSKLIKANSKEYLESHFAYLSTEQKDAVLGLTQDRSLTVLIGRAGAGKTTTLKAVNEIYQNEGFRVIGTSLSAMAAENLGQETGIKTATLHSWLYQWERYQAASEKFLSVGSVIEEERFKQLDWYQDLKRFESNQLTKNTILIVDEAGMVGTRQWSDLLTHVQRSGAKLIAVGDDNQFKAIEAGDFFRELKNQASQMTQNQNQFNNMTHLFNLQSIRRQQHDWMKDASQQLAELNISEALSTYEKRGHVHQTSKANLEDKVSSAYLQKLQSDQSKTGLVLAFTNAQTNSINQIIREQLRQLGLIEKKDVVNINNKKFAIGDRIVFLKNDKNKLTINDADGFVQKDLLIKNGTQGRIIDVDTQGNIKIQLADNYYTIIRTTNEFPKITIGQPQPEAIRKYNYTDIAHGYAVTTHKSQGRTVDFSIIAASKHIDAKGLYVAMTRHRNDVQLFYAKKDFNSFKALTTRLSHFQPKDLVKDYTIRPENKANWQKVKEYRLCALDAAVFTKANDWKAYQQIKKTQIGIGKEILADFSKHRLYVHQAGLTREMLEISTGQKMRPLSRMEEKAKTRVEIYGETAYLARNVWDDIRQTHPGNKCKIHPSYVQFIEIRNARNSLAQTISENYQMHREFVNQFSHVYGINHKTIASQSRQGLEIKEEGKSVGYDAKLTNAPNRAEGISKETNYSNFKNIQNNNSQEKKFEQSSKYEIRSLASEVMDQKDVKEVNKFVERFNEKGAEKGLKCDAYHNKQGKFLGLRFYSGEHKFKASEVDESLSKKHIKKGLDSKNYFSYSHKMQEVSL